MATDGKPGLPIVAKPESFAHVPPPTPNESKEAYIKRQVKTRQSMEGPQYELSKHILSERITRLADRSYCPHCESRQAAASLFTGMEDRRTKLKTILAPKVVIHGLEDPVVPVEAGRDVAPNIPGAELRLIPGMGHDLPVALVKSIADGNTAAASRAASLNQGE